jgi:hypothetical protein
VGERLSFAFETEKLDKHITSRLLSRGGEAGCFCSSYHRSGVMISRESASILDIGRLYFSLS